MKMVEKRSAIEVPVLIIGFNRPEIISQCLAKLRESCPINLYFACDGPRAEKKNEQKLVEEVRRIMERDSNWPCEKHFKYNDTNKGCEITESEAISWVLQDNEYVIVIEDDIIAPYSFLKFAQDMLYKYKDCESVYQISSNNTTPIQFSDNADYCFSLYGHIWGWATWKRAWAHFDLFVKDFNETERTIPSLSDLTCLEKKHLKNICERLKFEEKSCKAFPKHTWDYVWSYIKWRDGGLSIVPRVHLSSNVGVVGLHSKVQTRSHFRKYDENFEVRFHPKSIERNRLYDEYHYKKAIKQKSFLVRQIIRCLNIAKRIIWHKREL